MLLVEENVLQEQEEGEQAEGEQEEGEQAVEEVEEGIVASPTVEVFHLLFVDEVLVRVIVDLAHCAFVEAVVD